MEWRKRRREVDGVEEEEERGEWSGERGGKKWMEWRKKRREADGVEKDEERSGWSGGRRGIKRRDKE